SAPAVRSFTHQNWPPVLPGNWRHWPPTRVPRPGSSGIWALSKWPGRVGEVGDRLLTLFLCGDVMTGRGIDQVLPHPGDPELREMSVADARAYVQLAERANGRIPRPADFSWPWGDALRILDDLAPDVRVINLEPSITRSSAFKPRKAVHYRMSPVTRPGVGFLPDLSDATASEVIGRVRAAKRPGDVVVVSVHWGSNWGYHVDSDQVRFAHRLIGGGVDLVHGHSSHHPRPVEVFRGKL